jgi:hypothetical protein
MIASCSQLVGCRANMDSIPGDFLLPTVRGWVQLTPGIRCIDQIGSCRIECFVGRQCVSNGGRR